MPRFQNTALITFSINRVFLKVLGELPVLYKKNCLKETREHWFLHVIICKKKPMEQNKFGELFLTVNPFSPVEAHANSG